MDFVICPSCRNSVPRSKFCPECGSSLAGARTCDLRAAPEASGEALSDQGLTLLVDVCKKTAATVGGDGYTEIVLYLDEAGGQYWLHTYSKYAYMRKEAHASYTASPELAAAVLKYIEDTKLASWKDRKGIPLCGVDYVIRFRHGNEMIRLDSGKMPDGFAAYFKISRMLYAGIAEENRRYMDEEEA